MKQHYYINTNGKSEGPLSLRDLQNSIINRETQVYSEATGQWQKAEELHELKPLFPPARRSSFFSMRGTFVLIASFIIVLLSVISYTLFSSNRQISDMKAKEDAVKESIEYTKAYTREHISELVYVTNSSYSVAFFGGISGLRVSVTNSSELPMDLVSVEVRYIKDNGAVFKTETLHFNNLKPHTMQTQHAPESERGKEVECSISLVKSLDAGL